MHHQLFTSDGNTPFPIDHFYYGTYDWTPEKGLKEPLNKVHVEGVAGRYLVRDGFKLGNDRHIWFDKLSDALRCAADLIGAIETSDAEGK